jgi:hypothetical protein
MRYLLHSVLLKRYATMVDGEATPPVNVIEKAVDLHALRVIGSSGYQVSIHIIGISSHCYGSQPWSAISHPKHDMEPLAYPTESC